MNNLRLSTLTLSLAIAVFALGYVNPSFAEKPVKNCEPPEEIHPSCGGGSGGDELMSTFDVVVTIEGLAVDCSSTGTDCKSKPTRDDRLDRLTSLVVKEMDMTIPLQGFLATEFFDDGCFNQFNLDMDGNFFVFEPSASPRTIQAGYGFQGLDKDNNFQDYSFIMFCTIRDDDAIWVPNDNTKPVILECQDWILTSHGSLDYCEQETPKQFEETTEIEVIGPNSVD